MLKTAFSVSFPPFHPQWLIVAPQLIFSLIIFGIDLIFTTTPKTLTQKVETTQSAFLPFVFLFITSILVLSYSIFNFLTYDPPPPLPGPIEYNVLEHKNLEAINLKNMVTEKIPGTNYQATLDKNLHLLSLQPYSFNLLINTALIYSQQSKTQQAEKFIKLAQQINPNSPVFHN